LGVDADVLTHCDEHIDLKIKNEQQVFFPIQAKAKNKRNYATCSKQRIVENSKLTLPIHHVVSSNIFPCW